MVRPRVDLPQPDSPTRPTVSPRRTSRSTPSTAWSWPVVRLRKPCLTGKYFLRPRTRSRMSSSAGGLRCSRPSSTGGLGALGAHEAMPIGFVARGPFSHSQQADSCAPTGQQRRQLLAAAVEDVVAARREPAAVRPVERARHHAADRLQRRRVPHAEQRDRRQQRLGVRVLRRREGLLHGAALDDLAGVHHRDLVDHLRHDAEVVGDQEDRHAELLAEVLHQLEDLGLHGDVERRRGLVGDQELGVAAQRHADHHALAHAAGHLVRVVAHPLLGGRDPDEPHHLERARLRLLVADVLVEPDRLGDLLADREDRVERGHRLLEDHRDVVAADLRHLVLVERREVLTVEDDVRAGLDATGRVDELHDRERGHGLAAPGLTDDAERAALRDREVDAVDGPDQAAVGLEARCGGS